MPTAVPRPTPTATPLPASVAGFRAFLERLENARLADRPYLANTYEAQLGSTPLTGPQEAIFIWRGAARSVGVVGDMNNWQPEAALPLQKVSGVDLWWAQATFEPTARLAYRLLINDELLLDPRNPRTVQTGAALNSELMMPGYRAPASLQPDAPRYPAGALQDHTIVGAQLGQTRTFFVYTPAGQLIGARYPSVYLHDGGDYLTLAEARLQLDRLIGARVIPPVVAVFIPPINRTAEYGRNPALADFVALEVVPFVREIYGTDDAPGRTAVMGVGTGAVAAFYTALRHPDVFGLAVAQSPALTPADEEALTAALRTVGASQLRLYSVVGRYETAVPVGDARIDLLAAQRRLVRVMQARGFAVQAEERPEGHSWGSWAATFGDGLRAVLARQP